MKNVKFEAYEIKLPAWSVGTLIHSDSSGLDDEEIEMIRMWEERQPWWGEYAIYDVSEEEPTFCHWPAFGSPCDCYDCVVQVEAKE